MNITLVVAQVGAITKEERYVTDEFKMKVNGRLPIINERSNIQFVVNHFASIGCSCMRIVFQ